MCIFIGNVDALNQIFLRGQLESGFETIGQTINHLKGRKIFHT
jgi:hypothetical protein